MPRAGRIDALWLRAVFLQSAGARARRAAQTSSTGPRRLPFPSTCAARPRTTKTLGSFMLRPQQRLERLQPRISIQRKRQQALREVGEEKETRTNKAELDRMAFSPFRMYLTIFI
ncbi:hypothetical protein NDU88_006729 [Pleurodeles waltl]|uniref:Uncharacterized protein n=1 Tax=Pleurodeles waltl TaxID=8319 RepID=A0AAV7QPU7_PLEWA|nr:hypothetical protein NDU88_006729 [Pleurodeles waltl]